MGVLMGQLIIVDEDELNDLRFWAKCGKDLVKDLDLYTSDIYPKIKYWIDTGSTYNVSRRQLYVLAQDAEAYRKPWWKHMF